MAAMKGKRLPLIGRIEISIVEESNPRLLSFEKGAFDYITVPADLVAKVLDLGDGLQPRFAKAGVMLARGIQPAINYTYFNMDDPVVGGYTKERIALRRAIGMSYNCEEEITRPLAGPGRVRDAADPARRHRLRSRSSRVTCNTTSRRKGAPRQVRLQSIATATAGATFPTASRWSSPWGRRPTRAAASTRRCGSAASMPSG